MLMVQLALVLSARLLPPLPLLPMLPLLLQQLLPWLSHLRGLDHQMRVVHQG